MNLLSGLRRPLVAAAISLAVASLLVGGADAAGVTYGVSVTKGCEPTTFVGQKDNCFYVLSNSGATSGDTVTFTNVTDTVLTAGGPVTSPNILPSLELIFTPSAGVGVPVCTGGAGAGTNASPYVGATSCLVPFGSSLSTNDFPFYTTVAADFTLDPALHKLRDTVNVNWMDQCDKTPTPGTCDAISTNLATAPAATTMKQYTPTITTLLSSSSITVGQAVHDTSAIAFDTNPPVAGGTVTYKLYTDSTCTTLATTPSLNQTVNYAGGTPPNSQDVTFPAPGNFWFQATYSGDAADGIAGPVTSGCATEPLVVNKANSSTVTDVLLAGAPVVSAPLGSSVTDRATVSGTGAGTPTGTVTFTFFTNSFCTPAGTAAGVPALVAGVGTSSSEGPLAAGSYSFQAVYSGDSNYNGSTGPCEPLTVLKGTTTTVTTPMSGGKAVAAPLAPGSSVSDQATVAGAGAGTPTGTVTFLFFSNGTCTPAGTAAGTSALVAGSANSTIQGPLAVGSYSFQATYNGDANYTGSTGACEPFTVVKGTPTIATTLSAGSINTGGSAHDSATLTGLVSPDGKGTVTYTVFSDSACTAGAQAAGTVTESLAGAIPDSNALTFATAGTYYWQAVYSGDANNAPATSPCTSEVLVVSSPPGGGGGSPAIGITKNPKAQTIASGATANFTIVVTNTGTLTLNNVTVADPLSPGCAKTSADIPALASMAPGASVTYNCSLANVTASFTNVATATGTGTNGQTVTANDSAPVAITVPIGPPPPPPPPAVSHPAIGIVKSPKTQEATLNGTATFKITVTNTGDVTLTDVTVKDPLSPNCDRSLGTLAVGASKSYTCTKPNVKADFENIATVTGKPPTGAAVKATDHASVRIPLTPPTPQNPKIHIVKNPKLQTLTTRIKTTKAANGASKTTVKYSSARFHITVTNTGDVTLHAVTVVDGLSPACNHKVGTLAAHGSRSYTCARAAVSSSFTNVAIVSGLSPRGKKVTDNDSARVVVKVKTTSTSGAQFTG